MDFNGKKLGRDFAGKRGAGAGSRGGLKIRRGRVKRGATTLSVSAVLLNCQCFVYVVQPKRQPKRRNRWDLATVRASRRCRFRVLLRPVLSCFITRGWYAFDRVLARRGGGGLPPGRDAPLLYKCFSPLVLEWKGLKIAVYPRGLRVAVRQQVTSKLPASYRNVAGKRLSHR